MMAAYRHGRRRTMCGVVALCVVTVLVVGTPATEVAASSYSDALGWYGAQAEAGDAEAQYLLAYALEHGVHDEADLEAARLWYQKSAAQGHARASHRLALMLVEGRGGPVDLEAAQDWLEPLAEAGDPAPQSLLGYLLARGDAVQRIAAYQWLSLAADGGDASAASNLAKLVTIMSPEQIAEGEALIATWREQATH